MPAASPNPASPSIPRKTASGSASANLASNAMPIAVAWFANPAQWVAPVVSAAASPSATGSGSSSSGSVVGASQGVSATAVTSGHSVPAVKTQGYAQWTMGIEAAPLSPAPSAGDANASAENSTANIPQSGLENASPVAGSTAVAPQGLGKAEAAPAESGPVTAPVLVTQATAALEGQAVEPGTQASRAQTSSPQPAAAPVPVQFPAAFFSDAWLTQAQPAGMPPAAPPTVRDPAEPAAGQALAEGTSFAAEVMSGLAQGSPPAPAPAAPAAMANSALQTAAVAAVTAGTSTAAVVVSAQSAVPTIASLAKIPERGVAARAIANGAPSARSGPLANSPSAPPAAAVNAKSSAGTETPFSVFFSGNASTESAAAVLPRMIVPPAANASPHNNLQPSAVAGVATQNASLNNSAPQNGAPPARRIRHWEPRGRMRRRPQPAGLRIKALQPQLRLRRRLQPSRHQRRRPRRCSRVLAGRFRRSWWRRQQGKPRRRTQRRKRRRFLQPLRMRRGLRPCRRRHRRLFPARCRWRRWRAAQGRPRCGLA